MLLSSFFPLAIMILAVLGSIVFGLATPSEAAAMGSFGGLLLALAYRRLNLDMLKESVYLAAKTSAMVCWLFRSEEHTSELQSLMRISYAVFCLKKKTKTTTSK